MAPNVRAATLLAHHSHSFPFDDDDSERYLSTEHQTKTKENVHQVWKSMLEGKQLSNDDIDMRSIHQLLSSIRILDDPSHHQEWLSAFGGTLEDLPFDQVEAIHDKAPEQFTARVADFNENLLYAMQSERGLEHLGLSSARMKAQLQAHEYLGSFLSTEHTIAQPPHVDYTWEVLEDFSPDDLKLGFFPLTKDGMFLQVWPRYVTISFDTTCSIRTHSFALFIAATIMPKRSKARLSLFH